MPLVNKILIILMLLLADAQRSSLRWSQLGQIRCGGEGGLFLPSPKRAEGRPSGTETQGRRGGATEQDKTGCGGRARGPDRKSVPGKAQLKPSHLSAELMAFVLTFYGLLWKNISASECQCCDLRGEISTLREAFRERWPGFDRHVDIVESHMRRGGMMGFVYFMQLMGSHGTNVGNVAADGNIRGFWLLGYSTVIWTEAVGITEEIGKISCA